MAINPNATATDLARSLWTNKRVPLALTAERAWAGKGILREGTKFGIVAVMGTQNGLEIHAVSPEGIRRIYFGTVVKAWEIH